MGANTVNSVVIFCFRLMCGEGGVELLVRSLICFLQAAGHAFPVDLDRLTLDTLVPFGEQTVITKYGNCDETEEAGEMLVVG